jgi:hypothetical protein
VDDEAREVARALMVLAWVEEVVMARPGKLDAISLFDLGRRCSDYHVK